MISLQEEPENFGQCKEDDGDADSFQEALYERMIAYFQHAYMQGFSAFEFEECDGTE
jgi:hypothetical protein